MFRNSIAAKDIFTHWRNELGEYDKDERLLVTIIKGINQKKPYAYRVSIGSNPNIASQLRDIHRVVFVNRLNTMEPESNKNLKMFLDSYEVFGKYLLVPYFAKDKRYSEHNILWDYGIKKCGLNVREAWEIGKNDVDSSAIMKDDFPIIPVGQTNPPVLELFP